jgi:hypothetical protein
MKHILHSICHRMPLFCLTSNIQYHTIDMLMREDNIERQTEMGGRSGIGYKIDSPKESSISYEL